jgi:hypothetical protein
MIIKCATDTREIDVVEQFEEIDASQLALVGGGIGDIVGH